MANLLDQRSLTELVDAVELDLADSANAQISAAEVQACIRNAIYDLNRHIPQQKVYELTLDFTVTDEHFTADTGVAVSLANHPVKYGSESVRTIALPVVTFTRDTDYTMDYSNGTITALSTGSMTEIAYHISYEKSKVAVDLSAITDMIRPAMVEYPLGSVPQDIKNFFMWGDILWIGPGRDSQAQMGDTNHIVIYYEAEQNIATA